jgi:hypothetical protein
VPRGAASTRPLTSPERVARDLDGTGLGGLLHARCEMGRHAHRRVADGQIVVDRSDHNFTRVEADPKPDRPRRIVRGALRSPAPYRVLHVERGATRPERMVLMGDRRAEDGHDPIAQHLVHGALIGMHGIDHDLLERIEQPAGLLRIQVPDELGRALDVGEQDGDLFALSLDRGARLQDLLGERGRGIFRLRAGVGSRAFTWQGRDRAQQALARAHGQAELFQIDLSKVAQIGNLDLLGVECVGELAEPQRFEPSADAGHGSLPPSRWSVPHQLRGSKRTRSGLGSPSRRAAGIRGPKRARAVVGTSMGTV